MGKFQLFYLYLFNFVFILNFIEFEINSNFRFNTGYTDVMTYKDQKKFVIAVLFLEPSTNFPDGLIIVGGNDNTLFIYKPNEPFATFALKEHTNAGLFHFLSFILKYI